jgi:glucose-6-phosphate isomerase
LFCYTLSMRVLWKESACVDEAELAPYLERAAQYMEHLKGVWKRGGYSEPESALNLPFDTTLLDIRARAQELLAVPKLKYVLLLGIGGSSLGTQALYDAFLGATHFVERGAFPRLFTLDTLESAYLQALLTMLLREVNEARELAIVIVSKSGTTTETVANTSALLEALQAKFPDILARTVVITDKGSPLQQFADSEGIKSIFIPASVGGRFSVFSAVGLFPLALFGLEVRELSAGAGALMGEHFDGGDVGALETAALLAYYHDRGMRVHDTFLWDPALESMGKWYRQLLAESVGKERKVEGGALVRVGLTPTVSIGTNDLHSVAQLYFAGPRDKITTHVSIRDKENISAVGTRGVANILPQVRGKSFAEVMQATYTGVLETYRAAELPFMEISLEHRSLRELGAFMQYKMLETMYLAHLLYVNAFDQPAVERYKERTRKFLT